MNEPKNAAQDAAPAAGEEIAGDAWPRRALLRKLGRFAAVTPPAVTLLLSLKSKPALAVSSVPSSRQLKETVPLSSLRRFMPAGESHHE